MKIVIDITEKEFERVCRTTLSLDGSMQIYRAIREGTPLPKGHGRLIDADALQKQAIRVELKYLQRELDVITMIQIIDAPTIIEADTTRDCKTCVHSNGGKCAGTEECHDCMWESNYIEADKGE